MNAFDTVFADTPSSAATSRSVTRRARCPGIPVVCYFNDEEDTFSPFAVGALCLVQFVDVLGVAIVTIALPAILAGLDAPASTTPVLVTGYAMFFGGLLLLGARLGDRYGHRRVLLVGLAAFGAASALAGLGQHVLVVIAARRTVRH